jgi:hypothetical protein
MGRIKIPQRRVLFGRVLAEMRFPRGNFAARARARGSDFCEKLTFRVNFSQKIFLKKFSNFPENRLTTARKCGIIKKMN